MLFLFLFSFYVLIFSDSHAITLNTFIDKYTQNNEDHAIVLEKSVLYDAYILDLSRLGLEDLTGIKDLAVRYYTDGPVFLLKNIPNLILDLSYNALIDLPREEFSYLRLLALDLSYNQLTALPYMGRNIRYLNLSNNKFDKTKNRDGLSAGLCMLNDLENLNISNNILICLPFGLYNLKKLKVLKASNCCLVTIHERIEELELLEQVDLSGNELFALPLMGRRVRYLNLSNNKFNNENCDGMSACLRMLNDLENLDISSNMLICLPFELYNLKKLKVLKARNCSLAGVHQRINELRLLQEVDLLGNNFVVLYGNIQSLNLEEEERNSELISPVHPQTAVNDTYHQDELDSIDQVTESFGSPGKADAMTIAMHMVEVPQQEDTGYRMDDDTFEMDTDEELLDDTWYTGC